MGVHPRRCSFLQKFQAQSHPRSQFVRTDPRAQVEGAKEVLRQLCVGQPARIRKKSDRYQNDDRYQEYTLEKAECSTHQTV